MEVYASKRTTLEGGLEKHVIFHVGAHRCGSSTTQGILDSLRDHLASYDVAVLLRRDLINESKLRRLRLLHRQPFGALPAAMALRKISNERALISDENILGLMPGISGLRPYHGYKRAVLGLAILSKFVEVSTSWSAASGPLH